MEKVYMILIPFYEMDENYLSSAEKIESSGAIHITRDAWVMKSDKTASSLFGEMRKLFPDKSVFVTEMNRNIEGLLPSSHWNKIKEWLFNNKKTLDNPKDVKTID